MLTSIVPSLSAEHDAFRESVRSFALREVAPNVAQWDKDEYFPLELVARLGELGYFGLGILKQ